MNTSKKRFSLGWHIGLVLGVVAGTGATVYAVTIPNTFTDGQTASAAAVNANFQALKDAIDGCTTDMVRVGSSCVDSAAQYVTATTAGCEDTGRGCTADKMTLGATAPTPVTGGVSSWGHAVAACTNAGKRLATAREVIAALNAGAITTMPGNTFVEASAARFEVDGVTPGLYAGTFLIFNGGTDNTFRLAGTNSPYNEKFPDLGKGTSAVAFRCAR